MEYDTHVIQISNPSGTPFVKKEDYLDKLLLQIPDSPEGESFFEKFKL
jgi:hypothetical protein